MSVNRFLPHIFILPEDEANSQLAIGFQLNTDRMRQLEVLNNAGGWGEALKLFTSVHIAEMDREQNRFMILLIDFDERPERLRVARARIPNRLADRVFVLGAKSDPETLRQALRQIGFNSYERIGEAIANDCRAGTDNILQHEMLRHNDAEVQRLRPIVHRILFS